MLLAAAARIGADAPGARALGDKQLLGAQRSLAEAKRSLDACASVLAGEVVRRSSVDAGLGGLARKEGFRTPEALIRGVTGSTAREATTLIRVGSMLNDAELLQNAETAGIDDPAGLASMMTEPWLAEVGKAVAGGTLSVAGAEAIRTGLGKPGPGVTTEDLTAAATRLVENATGTASGPWHQRGCRAVAAIGPSRPRRPGCRGDRGAGAAASGVALVPAVEAR